MIPIILGFFAKPAVKWAAIGIAVLALIAGTLFYIDSVRSDGKKSGASEVKTKVQEETIKRTEDARREKVEADEKVRDKPLDTVIDGLR